MAEQTMPQKAKNYKIDIGTVAKAENWLLLEKLLL